MRTSIKINDQYIQKILLGSTPVQRIYQSGSIVYEAGGSTPCFEVVDTISEASGNYVDVYAWDTEKWYKRNNLSQYEEYGIMPTVNSLTGVTTYTGKLVILSTDSHEYKWNGSQWVDLGEIYDVYTEYEYVQGNGTSYIFTDYIPKDNTRVETDILGHHSNGQIFGGLNYWSSNGSAAKRCRVQFSQSTNIRYDFGDNRIDLTQSGLSNRLSIKLDSTGGYLNGTKIANFTSSTAVTGCDSILGIFCAAAYDYDTNTQIVQPGSYKYNGKMYYFKIYEGDNLVRDFVPATKDGIVGFYETVNHVMWGSYVSTQFTVGGSSTEHGSVPEDYPTKVAPANNVHYDTLAELELMECPWIGMMATVGQEYTAYVYTEDGWVLGEMPLDLPYLRFTPSQNSTFTFSGSGLKYSINGAAWSDLIENIETPTVPSGSYIIFKGSITPSGSGGIGTFSATGNFNVSGNVMSLIYDDDFTDKLSLSGNNYVFDSLFKSNTYLKQVTEAILPATTLSQYCYKDMFNGCSGLTSVHANLLPATTLAERCYAAMFYKCGSLTTSPLLPATNLAPYCYCTMFQSCRLSTLPALPATVMVDHCYDTMFNYVDANIPDNYLPSTQLAPYCYVAMFANSYSRTKTMSILPATTLASHCYDSMFINNSGITEAPMLHAETLVAGCYNKMFWRCTSLRKSPIIKADMSQASCGEMLWFCSSLEEVTYLGTTSPNSSNSKSWLYRVQATGTFYMSQDATWDSTVTRDANGVPSGWTIVKVDPGDY